MNHGSPLLAGVGLVPRTAPQTPPPPPSSQLQQQLQQQQTTTSAPNTCIRLPPPPPPRAPQSNNNGSTSVILHINMQRNWSSNQAVPASAEDDDLDDDDHEVQIVKQMPPQSSLVASQSPVAASSVATSSPSFTSQEYRGGLKIKSRPKKNGQVNIASHNNIEAVEKGSLIPGPTIIKQSQFNRPVSANNLESTNGTSNKYNSTTTTTTRPPTSQLPLPARVLPTSQGTTTTSHQPPTQQQRVSQQAKQTPLGCSPIVAAVMQQQPQSPTKQSSTQTEIPILSPTKAKLVTSSTTISTPPPPSLASRSKLEPRTPPLPPSSKVMVPEFLPQNGVSVLRPVKVSGADKSLNGHHQGAQVTTIAEAAEITTTATTTTATMTPNKKQALDLATEESIPFTWEKYFELMPGTPAPKEAFMQSPVPLGNLFEPGMKLEAKDIRSSSTSWSLASVIFKVGDRIRIRCDGSDNMNDFIELVDSDNIRPCGSKPGELLLPPLNYKSNISNYSKNVEKILAKPETKLAPSEAFKAKPKAPPRNLFRDGMKLEAIDRKNPHLVYPATVGEVHGDEIRIVFDFWKGSFDYSCKYTSREIFPINWCRDTGHPIQPPNAWSALVNHEKPSPTKTHRTGPKSQAAGIAINATAVATATARNSLTPNKPKNPVGRPRISHNYHDTPPAQASSPSPLKQASTTKYPSVQTKTVSTTPTLTKSASPTKPSPSPHKSSILKKAEKRLRSPSPDSSCSMNDDAINDADVDDDTETDIEYGENYYQCQRTVPYYEWKRLKSTPGGCVIKGDVETNVDEFKQLKAAGISSNLDHKHQSADIKAEEDTKPPRKKVAFSTYAATVETVSDVVDLIKTDESLSKYSCVFEANEIDGKAFVLLTTDVMVNHMGLKIGPVLKINKLIEQVRRGKH